MHIKEKLTVSHIESFSYEEDVLTVKFSIPHSYGTVSYEETFKWGESYPPQKIKELMSQLLTELVVAVNDKTATTQPLPCETCTSACCRNWPDGIRVSREDVSRLLSGKHDPSQMVDLWDGGTWEDFIEKLDAFEEGTGESPVMAIDGSVGVLKMVPWRGIDKDETACTNLSPSGSGCLVYEHRPLVCRSFQAYGCAMHELDPAKKEGLVKLRVR